MNHALFKFLDVNTLNVFAINLLVELALVERDSFVGPSQNGG